MVDIGCDCFFRYVTWNVWFGSTRHLKFSRIFYSQIIVFLYDIQALHFLLHSFLINNISVTDQAFKLQKGDSYMLATYPISNKKNCPHTLERRISHYIYDSHIKELRGNSLHYYMTANLGENHYRRDILPQKLFKDSLKKKRAKCIAHHFKNNAPSYTYTEKS